MTNLEFMKEEYLALRKEIEASVSELATLERQCESPRVVNQHPKFTRYQHPKVSSCGY